MELKIEKKDKIKSLVLVLLAGLMLLVFSVPGLWTKKAVTETTVSEGSVTEQVPVRNADEIRLGAVLSEIKGVGKVESMIVFRSGDKQEGIEGILIVAEGAENVEIVRDISDAAEALFGIPKHKIVILPMQMKGK